MSKKIAIIIHNLTLYYTIKPLYIELKKANYEVDIYVADNYGTDVWQSMANATYEEISKHNPVLHASQYDGSIYDLAFYPYLPYAFEVNSVFSIRYQYGIAKPEWNFQPSTLLFDVCLCYGNYDYQFLQHYCSAHIVGNLKYAHLSEAEILKKNKILNPEQGISILYLPTYGKECAIETLCNPLLNLPDNWSIAIKLHHGVEFLESARLNQLTASAKIKIYRQNELLEDLILSSDLVISDGSSACFDAIYFNKPLIIAGEYFGEDFEGEMPINQQLNTKYQLSHFNSDKDLTKLIQETLADSAYMEKLAKLRDYFFPIRGQKSLDITMEVIEKLLNTTTINPYHLTKAATKKWYLQKNQQLRQSQQALADKSQELYNIYQSRSWKIAMMLKKIKNPFK